MGNNLYGTGGWSSRIGRSDARVVGLLSVVAASFALRFREIGFLGWDAYPILAACRLDSLADLPHVLGRPLGGDLLKASFYRPVLSLSVALEEGLRGLSAGGYVATNAVLFGLCGLALYVLARRLSGGSGPVAGFAVAFFALHPAALDVVPYLPRRPELLCTLFCLVALVFDHRGRFEGSRRALVAGWLAAAAAAGSKETAVVLPLLIALARGLFPAPGAGGAGRQTLRGLAAHAAAVAVLLVPRWWILGGAGGYPDTDVSRLPQVWLATLAKTLLGVFAPEGAWRPPVLAGLALLAAGAVLRLGRRGGKLRSRQSRLLVFSGAWFLVFATVYAAGARLSPWYLLIVACGASIGFGVALELALDGVRPATRGRRSPAAGALLGGALLLGTFAAGSPLVRPPVELALASRASTEFLGALEAKIRSIPAGGRIEAGPYPRVAVGAGGGHVAVLAPPSVRGWARVVFPRRRIAVIDAGVDADAAAAPGVTVVVLGRGVVVQPRDLRPGG